MRSEWLIFMLSLLAYVLLLSSAATIAFAVTRTVPRGPPGPSPPPSPKVKMGGEGMREMEKVEMGETEVMNEGGKGKTGMGQPGWLGGLLGVPPATTPTPHPASALPSDRPFPDPDLESDKEHDDDKKYDEADPCDGNWDSCSAGKNEDFGLLSLESAPSGLFNHLIPTGQDPSPPNPTSRLNQSTTSPPVPVVSIVNGTGPHLPPSPMGQCFGFVFLVMWPVLIRGWW